MSKPVRSARSELEFISLMASMMALTAMAIDSILPALTHVGKSINHSNANDLQLIIITLFLGIGAGQLVFGPLSDSIGRKPAVYAGISVFIIASIICVQSTNLTVMLVGRALQGFGLAATRTISISIVRDLYSGSQMARIMSFISLIFIIIPMVAPILGQFILSFYHWQAIFYAQILLALITFTWFFIRQPETLSSAKRIKLSTSLIKNGMQEFFKFKESVFYTLILGLLSGSFMAFLSSSKQIFQDQYGMIGQFAYIFAIIAFFLGISTLTNGILVVKLGMRKLALSALASFSFSALVYIALFYQSENPHIVTVVIFLIAQVFSLGFIFGNLNALAMQPIGHIAGIGASIIGFTSTLMATPIAILIGRYLDTTALPLFIGFFVCGFISFVAMLFFSKHYSQHYSKHYQQHLPE